MKSWIVTAAAVLTGLAIIGSLWTFQLSNEMTVLKTKMDVEKKAQSDFRNTVLDKLDKLNSK